MLTFPNRARGIKGHKNTKYLIVMYYLLLRSKLFILEGMEDLTYDYTFMMADTVGEHGATEAELETLRPTLEKIHQDFLYQKDNDQLGFTRLPYESATVQAVQKLADEVRRDFSALVVLGIGGSDLGARALHAALNHKY